MVHPWQRQEPSPSEGGFGESGESGEPVEVVISGIGPVAPPAINKPVDFLKLDMRRRKNYETQKNMFFAKKQTTELDEYDKKCEREIQIQFSDGSSATAHYGVSMNLDESIEDERFRANLRAARMRSLNPMQRKAIALTRTGGGVIVKAPTGIGKTLAFMIPAIEVALSERRRIPVGFDKKPSPFVLVLSNTGRLANQTFERCNAWLGLTGDEGAPIEELKLGKLIAAHRFATDQCDIAFATMGKLKATIDQGELGLQNLKMIVLDEADKMMDETAFGMDIKYVLDKLPDGVLNTLQACFYSATYLSSADGGIMLSPLQEIMFGDRPYGALLCPGKPGYIKQRVVKIETKYQDRGKIEHNDWIVKMCTLTALIEQDLKDTGCTKEGPYKETILIFCDTVQKVLQIAVALRQAGYNFKPICSAIEKHNQDKYLKEMTNCEIHGLVATDIMARGIDIPTIKHSIAVGMSANFQVYTHRIGRVGRDGSGGKSTVILDDRSMVGSLATNVEFLVELMNENEQEIPGWLYEWYINRRDAYSDY